VIAAGPIGGPGGRRRRIAALVLAAGRSRRMGGSNKLLAEIGGRTLVARVARTVLDSGCAPVHVVTGYQRARIEAALAGYPVEWTHNPRFAAGLGASLAVGARGLPGDTDAVLVCLGDMPLIRASHIERLIADFDPIAGRAICVSAHAGRRGHPVLFDRRFVAELGALDGDRGARALLARYADCVSEVEMDDDGVLIDIDDPASLAQIAARA